MRHGTLPSNQGLISALSYFPSAASAFYLKPRLKVLSEQLQDLPMIVYRYDQNV